MDKETITYLAVIIILILFSAFFSATETAFSSLSKTKMKALAEKGNRRAELVCHLLDNYDKLISTILIGNNIVNIAMASISTVMFVRLFDDSGATISTAVITILVLIFGEITPKSLAKDCPIRFSLFSAPYIRLMIYLLMPLSFLFSLWKKLIAAIFKIKDDNKMSQEELLLLVEEVQQDGGIDQDEGSLLKNAIEFSDMRAEDILTHRVDLEAVSIDDSRETIARVFEESAYSRLLVYEETIDHIVGVLHQKDFYSGMGVSKKPLSALMTPPLFVMKSERIDNIMKLLQEKKAQIAVVLDEYGGTLGIVTLEDILEELVGEIWDEHDEVTEDFAETEENRYSVDCSANLVDFCDQFGVDIESESVSVGGFVMEQLGKMPEVNDTFTWGPLTVKVTETDGQRVVRASVTVNPEEKSESDHED